MQIYTNQQNRQTCPLSEERSENVSPGQNQATLNILNYHWLNYQIYNWLDLLGSDWLKVILCSKNGGLKIKPKSRNGDIFYDRQLSAFAKSESGDNMADLTCPFK